MSATISVFPYRSWVACLVAGLAAACAAPPTHPAPVAEPPKPTEPVSATVPASTCAEPELTWENTGQPFVRTWCDSCHAASQTPAGRLGAPVGVSFDDLEETRTWAARIDARALALPATMPPATVIPEEDLEPVRAWFACGLPGEDDPIPAESCTLPAYVGDLRLSEADPTFCDSFSSIDGDLVVDTDSAIPGCLCDVTGEVAFEGYSGHEWSAPLLSHVGGLTVARAAELAKLDLPELVIVDRELVVDHVPALDSLQLPLLERVGGAMAIKSAPLLGSIDAYRLAEVGAGLSLIDVPSVSWFLPFDSLTAVGGDLVLRGTGAVEAQDFRRLETIGGSLEIASNAALVSLEGYDVLASIGGNLSIHDNLGLALLEPMPVLEQVRGDVIVVANPRVPARDLRAFAAGIDEVRGAIHLDQGGNP